MFFLVEAKPIVAIYAHAFCLCVGAAPPPPPHPVTSQPHPREGAPRLLGSVDMPAAMTRTAKKRTEVNDAASSEADVC